MTRRRANRESTGLGRAIAVGNDLRADALRLLVLLRPATPIGLSKVRIGNPHGDGGYVMLDDWDAVVGAISIGIGGDVSWDVAIAERGIDVRQYDHTVPSPPLSHPRFRFQSVGIGRDDDADARLLSLATMVRDAPGDGDLIVKMDVEGAEWSALAAVGREVVERFSQMVIEFHAPLAGTTEDRLRNLGVLGTLCRTHRVVHVHANNYAPVDDFDGLLVPNVLEVSYLRRSRASFRAFREALPAAVDVPNNPHWPEISMSAVLAQARVRA